ncbi:MAG: cell wall-binding repeat-containing protein [Actinomycetota bacterium]|nr:cell wall-binding repeat-containing protein [Actinomycetota bacterium]
MSARHLSLLTAIAVVAAFVVGDAVVSRAGGAQLVDVVYIATGENYPDALAAGPATGGEGPILLVTQNSIPQPTIDELIRLNPKTIFIVGGEAVISAAVEAQLDNYTTGAVIRLAGSNRYATAAAISEDTFPVTGAFSCAGRGFHPETGSWTWGYSGGQRVGASIFSCPVSLPHGVTMTSLRVTARDNSDAGEVHCDLARVDLRAGFIDPTVGDFDILTGVSTGGSPIPGDTELVQSLSHVVNNTGYGYWITCFLGGGEIGLYGVIIEYRR